MLRLSALYPTFNGEQSVPGIGSAVIFLRLGGCHLRCYLPTLKVLCDTPESLDRKSGEELEVDEIVRRAAAMRDEYQIYDITLTGGDPLWNKPELLKELLVQLTQLKGFRVSIETSGTLEWEQYRMPNVHFVLDYKLPSCGDDVYSKNLFVRKPELANGLEKTDFVKFVIHDWKDFGTALGALEKFETSMAKIVFGVYWKGPIKTADLTVELLKRKLLGRVHINVQLHKFVYEEMYGAVLPTDI